MEDEAGQILVELLKYYMDRVSEEQLNQMLDRIYKCFGIVIKIYSPREKKDVDIDKLIKNITTRLTAIKKDAPTANQ